MNGRPYGRITKLIQSLLPGAIQAFETQEEMRAAREAARRSGIAVTTQKCKDGWHIKRLA